MTEPLLQTTNLSQIYPDISEELCNKHAKLLSELKNRFTELYDDLEPEKYVIVNGIARVVDLGASLQVSFAMENGVTVLYRKTYPNEDIFINGNHLEEEVIFNAKGRHTEGIHEKVDEVRDLIAAIRKNASAEKVFFGGIIYIHSNIGEDLFAFHESFMLSVFLALLQLHDQLHNYSKADILNCLMQADGSLSPKSLESLLGQFQVGKCNVEFNSRVGVQSDNELDLTLCDPHSDKSIKTHDSNESIKMIGEQRSFKSTASKTLRHRASTSTKSNDSIQSLVEEQEIAELSLAKLDITPSHRLILCRLDLSLEEQQTYQSKVARIKELNELLQQERLGKFDVFEEEYLRNSAFKDMVEEEDYDLLRYCEETRILLNALVCKRVDFSEFIAQKHDLDIKYEVFDEEVVMLINQIHQEAPFLKNFCIIEGTVLMISMDKQYYPEIIRFLRRLFNDYKLSTYRFLQTHRKLPEEDKQCQIGEIMFTTSPSLGCAIYNPAENCWL